ncbi:hypothetical protein ACFL9T_00050 [Thermodesulfobacteriota bacterium]
MNFGIPNKVILFGGGKLLSLFLFILDKHGLESLFVTSKRHAKEIVDGDLTLEEFLIKNKKKFIITNNINDKRIISEITDKTLGISSGAAWIFKPEFIDRFKGRLLNSHGSRLPQDRGAGDFSWRIMRREPICAVLLHKIDSGIDTGDIIKYEEYIFPSCRKPIDYQEYSRKKYLLFLDEFINEILEGKNFNCIKQQDSFSTYFPRLNTDTHGFINWDWTVEEIESFICAFDEPYKGASTFINDKRIWLKECYLTESDGMFHPFQSGIIYRITDYGLFVAARGGSIVIKKVEDEKGNSMLEEIELGSRFHTPVEYLEKAKMFRAVYTPDGLLNEVKINNAK